jgi:predicted DNA-binding transcriptional regulator YafY
MLASRLLSLLMLLQSRGRMSAPALARQLEVSVRTVYRDIDSLSAAGVPVYGEPGRNGGYQLRDGWRTQLTGLTSGEARALFLAGLPGPAKALGMGEAAASAHLKLMAALPGDWQADAERVGSRFHLDPVDWFRDAAPADHLREVAQAVWNEQRLRMRYESWTEVAEREIDPLGLVLKAGAWYVVGRRGRVARTYRLSNMHEVQLLRRHPAFRRRRVPRLRDAARLGRRLEALARLQPGGGAGGAAHGARARRRWLGHADRADRIGRTCSARDAEARLGGRGAAAA